MSANNTMTATAVVKVLKDADGNPKLRTYSPANSPEFKQYSGWNIAISDSETNKFLCGFLVKTTKKEVAEALTKNDGKVAVLVGYLRNENLAGKNPDGTKKPDNWQAIFNVVEVR